jgi:micrococcal nuclease
VKDVSEIDRYGRLLRYVYLNDVFINKKLVEEGYASASTYPPDVAHIETFRQAEAYARNNKLGLWGDACTDLVETVITEPGSEVPTQINAPKACTIKGNISSEEEKIYHIEGCQSYTKTIIDESKGERWFCSENEALLSGWRKALNC